MQVSTQSQDVSTIQDTFIASSVVCEICVLVAGRLTAFFQNNTEVGFEWWTNNIYFGMSSFFYTGTVSSQIFLGSLLHSRMNRSLHWTNCLFLLDNKSLLEIFLFCRQRDIEFLLGKFCSLLPNGTLHADCDKYADVIAPILTQLLLKDFIPINLCKLFTLCNSGNVAHIRLTRNLVQKLTWNPVHHWPEIQLIWLTRNPV